ncbi:MAG: hypothetical protein ABH886_02295, partial [Candidatus Desantisbacteria bacterium]
LPVPTAFHIFLKSLCLIQSVLVHRIIKSLGSIIFVIIMPSLYIKRFHAKTAKTQSTQKKLEINRVTFK